MDRELRNLERRAAGGDPEAEALLEAAINRIHGSPKWRAWIRELDRISQQIPKSIDAIFNFWRVLTQKSPPTTRDFEELFSQALKSSWFEDEILSLYTSRVTTWLNDRWQDGQGNGITGWDLSFEIDPSHDILQLRLNLGIQQPSEEEAEDQCIEIDEFLANIDYDLNPLGRTLDISWDSESDYETNKEDNDEEDDDEELEVYANFQSTCHIQLYHVLAVLDAHNKYAAGEIIKQYVESFSQD